MDLDELRFLVERLSYKPNTKIKLEFLSDRTELPVLVLEANVPNTRCEGPPFVTVSVQRALPFIDVMTEGQLLANVRSMIVSFEVHEVDEWFALDGRGVSDPHTLKPGVPIRTHHKERLHA